MKDKYMADEKNSIGLVEFNSIGAGIEAADGMLKVSDVELLFAKTICPGKYICLVRGDVAAVRSSVSRGEMMGRDAAIDSMVLPRVHGSVFPAINAASSLEKAGALGIIETFSVASCLEAADVAAKAAKVQILDIRLAIGLGGKSFLVLTGDVSAVRAAVEAGKKPVTERGLLVRQIVIPSPCKELIASLM